MPSIVGTPLENIDPKLWSPYHYIPSQSAGIALIAVFGLSTLLHTGFALWHRMWWILPTIVLCGVLEILGWAARLWSHYEAWNGSPFEMQICATILAPTPLLAAIFVLFGEIIRRLGSGYSRLSAKYYTIIFCTCDVVALIVQGVGGGLAATAAETGRDPTKGGNIMLGGITFQLVVIVIFSFCVLEYFVRYSLDRPVREVKYGSDRETERGEYTTKVKFMALAIGFTTLVLFIRAVYRTIELSDGWNGVIISTERYFTPSGRAPRVQPTLVRKLQLIMAPESFCGYSEATFGRGTCSQRFLSAIRYRSLFVPFLDNFFHAMASMDAAPYIKLGDLPAELHFQIFFELEPHDLLQLKAVCSPLRDLVSERHVWEYALKKMCLENHIFEPTYDINAMSVFDIQRASLTPWRWRMRRLGVKGRAEYSRALEWRTAAILQAHSHLSGELKDILSVQVVPGGRYLLAHSDSRISLWDVGNAPGGYSTAHGKLPEPKILDSLPCSPTSYVGTKIAGKGRELSLYEAGPGPPRCQIRLLSQLSHNLCDVACLRISARKCHAFDTRLRRSPLTYYSFFPPLITPKLIPRLSRSSERHTVLNVYARLSRRRSSSSSSGTTRPIEGATVYNIFDNSHRHTSTTHYGNAYTTINHNHSAEATSVSEPAPSSPTGASNSQDVLGRMVASPETLIDAGCRQLGGNTEASSAPGEGSAMRVGIVNQTVNVCCENCLELALARARESGEASRSSGTAGPQKSQSPGPSDSGPVQSSTVASTLVRNIAAESMDFLGNDYHSRSVLDFNGSLWEVELSPGPSHTPTSHQSLEQQRHSQDSVPKPAQIF
ncbi:hypothetical protein NMY22_g6540 [Coprinellus aureogranulatus]|nr:hypothetical protein NMY22_g6540 [Coprinellus aureogranulatus]